MQMDAGVDVYRMSMSMSSMRMSISWLYEYMRIDEIDEIDVDRSIEDASP